MLSFNYESRAQLEAYPLIEEQYIGVLIYKEYGRKEPQKYRAMMSELNEGGEINEVFLSCSPNRSPETESSPYSWHGCFESNARMMSELWDTHNAKETTVFLFNTRDELDQWFTGQLPILPAIKRKADL